jgi:hypothetical protein
MRKSFYYSCRIENINQDLDRLSEKEKAYTVSQTIDSMVNYWHRDIVEAFKRDLFYYHKEEPYQDMMNIVVEKFNQEWRPAIEKNPKFSPLIERLESEMSAQEADNVVRVRTVDRK